MEFVRPCIECGEEMRPVKLVVHGFNEVHHMLAEYADASAEPGFLIARCETKGRVMAWRCEGCGRIAMYGVPYP